MANPFPGMDPYLENPDIWPGFYQELWNCLEETLAISLSRHYGLNLGERAYRPEHPDFLPELCERYIEIRRKSDGQIVTLVDVVSPANRLTSMGRQAYLATRVPFRVGHKNLVEIDLVSRGQPIVDFSREGLPGWDYGVTVVRSTYPERYEVYTATLRKRLPRFRLPLAADDRDMVLDLNLAVNQAHDQGNFAARIDYRREPPMVIKDEDRNWLGQLLDWPIELRLTHRNIAEAAYYIWQNHGCPHGRAEEHWRLATERLKQAGREIIQLPW